MNSAGGVEKLEGGLAYYFMPPENISDVIYDPVHFIVYFIFITTCCGLFSKFWLEISGRSATDILRQFHENGYTIAGAKNDESIYKILNKHITTAAIFGGICIGVLSVFSDLIGTVGSGTGMLLVVNIIYGYFEQYKDENDMSSKIRNTVEF